MPSNHLLLCHPLLLLSSILPSIRVFSNESVLHIMWPKYWSFSFSISLSSEYLGLISFRIDWFDLLCSPRDSRESSPAPQFKSINSSVLSFFFFFNNQWKYLANKRDEIGSFVVMWMNLESVIQSEVSQKEKNKYHILTHIWNLEKCYRRPICRAVLGT